jgi:PST family polysaccharide transporter
MSRGDSGGRVKNLKEKTVRGGFAKSVAQGATFALRLLTLAVMARLLDPQEFGLVNMVTAATGVLAIFKDAGLSLATVQRDTVTEEQLTTLFWLNILVGTVLTLVAMAMAPLLASFYGDPRLVWVTVALAPAFLLNALGVQHWAILARQVRFTASAVLDLVAICVSTAAGVLLAWAGAGYWALVATSLAMPAVSSAGAWAVTRWVPGRPRVHTGVGSMVRVGGAVTLNGVVVYAAYNLEKVLLGRFWGADALGVYGRAYQLANIPFDNVNTAIGGVAISALSRVQGDRSRLRSYFLKAYSLVLALSVPVTIACALFAKEIVYLFLGPRWHAAAELLRLLAPTILVYALINPLFWLLVAEGKMARSVYMAFVIAPLVISAYFIGLPHGPMGVALAYSSAMVLWVVPGIAWSVRGTVVGARDLLQTVGRPLIAGLAAALLTLAFQTLAFQTVRPPLSNLESLLAGGTLLASSYSVVLLFVMGQKEFYLDLLRSLRGGTSG